jgi:hypothetical protein
VEPGKQFNSLLGRHAARVGLLDRMDDARERRILGRLGCFDGERAITFDGAGKHIGAGLFLDGYALASGRLINCAGTFNNTPVERDASACRDNEAVAEPPLGDGYNCFRSVGL